MKRKRVTRNLCGLMLMFAALAFHFVSPAAKGQSATGCTDAALTLAENQLTDTLTYTSATQFPDETNPSNGNKWNLTNSGAWTSGFFPGWIWFIYEKDLSSNWLAAAQAQTASLQSQDTNASTHDIGFRMLGSFGNEYRITRDPAALNTILTAAQAMTSLYQPTAGVINSWPFFDSQHITVIIDNMMNLELLFLGAQNGGSQAWYNMAVSHAMKTMENNVRLDGSTFQVVQYNSDGTVYDKLTTQGAGTNTTWSRGQAWGIYGFTMTYRYTKDPQFLATAQLLADYFINNLPSDYVPYWDFSQSGAAPRDSSAAAIAAAGLVELSTYVDAADQTRFQTAALNIQTSLSSPAYLGVRGQTSGILLHGAANVPAGDYDKSLIFGDYYFIQSCYRAMPLPAAPTNLTATTGSSNEINLAWDTQQGAVRYSVKRGTTSGGPYAVVAPPPVLTTNSYSDTSVTAGSANYYYVVSATNVAGEGPNSTEVLVPANNPVPTISSVSPTNVAAGAGFTLTVNGTGFLANSVISINGKAEPTAFLGATQLTAAVPANDVAIGGTPAVTVTNVPPGGGVSPALKFAVNDFSMSGPASASVTAGNSAAIPLAITPSNGNGFGNAVTFGVSGLPSNVTANFSPSSVTPAGGPVSTTLTLTAGARSQIGALTFWLRSPRMPVWVGLWCAALALSLLCAKLSFPLRPKLLFYGFGLPALLFVSIAGVSGCGGAGPTATTTTSPTLPAAPQSFNLTISAQSGFDTKTRTLTLIVQ